jgi:ribosome-binding factor A
MADSRRVKKYSDSIKKAVSTIIEFKLSDPDKGMITITKAKVSPDLKIASLYYTVLGDEEQKEKSRKVLERSHNHIKNELKPYITSRFLPELRFFYDDSMEYAIHINELLQKIKTNDTGTK